MGMFDDFLKDVKAIRKELDDTKKDITSGFSGMVKDYDQVKKQASQTVEELRNDVARTKQQITGKDTSSDEAKNKTQDTKSD